MPDPAPIEEAEIRQEVPVYEAGVDPTEVVIESAGGICPYQAEGLYRGFRWYLRARHQVVQVSVASIDSGKDPVLEPLISEVGEWLVFQDCEPYTEAAAARHIKSVLDAYIENRPEVGVWTLNNRAC